MKIEGKGVYTLILFLDKISELNIGKLGLIEFQDGWYAYNGSAMNKGSSGLFRRIRRHLVKKKKCFWHIDYLVNSKASSIKGVIYANTEQRYECTISKKMKEHAQPVKRFGSSDCIEGCGGHLFYFGNNKTIFDKILRIYDTCTLEAVIKENPTLATCLQ